MPWFIFEFRREGIYQFNNIKSVRISLHLVTYVAATAVVSVSLVVKAENSKKLK